MLLHLSIENFVLIRKLDISFSNGFSAITGETGAGKSILVGALGLILGQRADTQVLMDKTKKCIVEGTFSLSGYGLEPVFEANDLDFESLSIFRREINVQGKSRAFLNDTPVSLALAKEIGDRLVDIHSQNQTLALKDSSFQMAVIDNMAGHQSLLRTYSGLYQTFKQQQHLLQEYTLRENQAIADRDYLEFQFRELELASLQTGEQESIEQQLKVLDHAEEIKTRLFSAVQLLSGSEDPLLHKLMEVNSALTQAARYHPAVEAIQQRFNSCLIEMKDISAELEVMESHIHFDEKEAVLLRERLDLIYHLEQKHHVNTVEELITQQLSLSDKLTGIATLSADIEKLTETIRKSEKELNRMAAQISANRHKAKPVIEKEMASLLESLALPDARLEIVLSKIEQLLPNGKDLVEIHFNANKGGEMREVGKVASGGELSRLMLALKSLLNQKGLLPTVIFDEIDNGVSGEIAGKVGAIMQRMAQSMQVIAITHLPQIAGKAQHHYLAYKATTNDLTISSLRQLGKEERVEEIARMLSNEVITDSAKRTAKELLRN
jgi:DNA repair protein RecN (Recombination protein N)